ncbi:putative zinc- or iron-chelating protein [Paraburkholderia rhizosphaerae]|uniref:Putative zinc-or iron-chelating protein n=2 Tax=Paraburkholderia rhizosphaerae TaxID=480658 RepID=A0A4R8LJN6_9BURK|nr:putative zinc- or iron-chelating protein [Paraburkholderia rhizosphaerae]
MCGQCCHDLRLPLSLDEALAWLTRGGTVQLFCEAIPWPDEPPASHLQAQHKRRRSFASNSAALPVRVIATIVATYDGPCPNLGADMRCGIYDARPRVCRIYPAESNPFIELAPASKACPPDAWSQHKPVFSVAGKLVDARIAQVIDESRAVDARDASLKDRLCALLRIDTAALANEGFAIHSPARDDALHALQSLDMHADRAAPESATQWRIVSNQRATVDTLASIGALHAHTSDCPNAAFEYLGFNAAT